MMLMQSTDQIHYNRSYFFVIIDIRKISIYHCA